MKNQIEILRRLYHNRGKKVKSKPAAELSDQALEALHALKTSGIYIWKNFLSVDKVAALKSFVDETYTSNEQSLSELRKAIEGGGAKWGIPQEEGYALWVDEYFSDFRIIGAEKVNDLAAEFGHSQLLSGIGGTYLEQELKLNFCMLNRTAFKENNPGSGGGWHRDINYARGFKALTYLVDVGSQQGPFEYIRKSAGVYHHLFKTPTPDKYQFTEEDINKLNQEKDTLIVSAKAGDMVLFDTNGIHRGKPVEKGVRYAMTNYYQ